MKISTIIGLLGIALASIALLYSAWFMAPVNDEYGHLYAGLAYWQFGDSSVFKVNPPVLRAVVAAPAYLIGMRIEPVTTTGPMDRPEFRGGRDLFRANPKVFQWYLSCGRMIAVGITLGGSVILYRWGRLLAGTCAGLIASGGWLFQPQTLSHGALITGDVVCAVFLLLAIWIMQWTFDDLTMNRSVVLGIAIGNAILIKFTAVLIIPTLFFWVSWNAYRYSKRRLISSVIVMMSVSSLVIAIPYSFQGFGIRLSDYKFVSELFIKLQATAARDAFTSPWVQEIIRIPVPQQLLLGLDRQQWDFEHGLPSYAAGYRGQHGWWWFYLYSMLVKIPVGSLVVLFTVGVCVVLGGKKMFHGVELPLLLFTCVIVSTSIQDGFAQQHRYVLPAYPPMFLMMGVIITRFMKLEDESMSLFRFKARYARIIFGVGMALSLVEVSLATPHWLGQFNVIAGGKRNGYRCLFNDASDWGQDLYRLRSWISSHKNETVYVISSVGGIEQLKATGAEFEDAISGLDSLKKPSWLIVSLSDYVIAQHLMNVLDKRVPDEMIGRTHFIYRFEDP